ncbi:MAG: type II secretion system F family protein [Bellilinea sp.]|jgi:tight adherence protein C|nr:type II secretion system F family protein [Bellilinea sp.]HAD06263.1 type II secretion system protein [Anaerolineaceae bacterium]
MWILFVVGGLVILGAVILTVIGLRNPELANERALQARLEEFSRTGEQVDLRKLELSQPFTQRVIYPLARKMGELAVRFTPQNAINSINRKLELAGSPANIDATMILALQAVCAVIFGGLVVLVFTVGATKWPFGRVILFAFLFGGLGYMFPQLWLSSKISRRQKEIRKAMPDALDLLTICVEAGLGFDAAMSKVSEKWESQLSFAFARTIQEIQLGKVRREALRDMAERIGIPEMTSFVAAVIQSEQLGVSLAKVLRIQSDQMRVKRRQRAEEEAHKAPLKMLIPMALLIFPSLMIVLLTPAALRLFQSALGGMFQ